MIRYLNLDDLLEIHGRVLEATGGAEGVRDIGLLDSALARPQAAFSGLDLYPTISEKAAALLHSLIKNHPFVDANKRTAFTAMDLFLRINGFRLTGSEDEKYTFVMAVADGSLLFPNIAPWIGNHIKKA